MDIEKSFDSDTSESWSLIDINDEYLAESDVAEGVDIAEVLTCEASTSETKITETGISNSCAEETQNLMQNGTFSNDVNTFVNVASSSNGHILGHQDFQILYKGKVFENDCDLKKKSSEFNCSESSYSEGEKVGTEIKDLENDTDGISIISESECNDLKLSADETDDISDEKLSESNSTEKIQPNVLKRKRKRLKLNYRDSSGESINGDFKVPDGKYYADIESIDFNGSDDEMQLKEYENAPVYRHYRNNVANTALSVAMGVIFTGVACIAIGHFLGVHDAQYTAGEMMQTLKRLQMENVLLHTRLAQLSRAFFSRGNSKPTLRHNNEDNCLETYIGSQKTVCDINKNNLNEDDVKNSIFFNGRSIDISTNLNEPADALTYKHVQNGDEFPILREVHDHTKIFNFTKFEENNSKALFSTTTPVKTGNVQRKFILPSVIDKIESEQHDRAGKRENKDCQVKGGKFENCNTVRRDSLPKRQRDLIRFRRLMLKEKNKLRRSSEIKTEDISSNYDDEFSYKFPQPEEYYKDNAIGLGRVTGKLNVLNCEGDELEFISDRGQVKKLCLRNLTSCNDKNEKIISRKTSPKPGKCKKRDEDLKPGKCYIYGKDAIKKKKIYGKKCPNLSNRTTKEHKGKYLKDIKMHKNGSSKKLFTTEECSKVDDEECEVKPNRKVENDNYHSNKKCKWYIKENRSKVGTMKQKDLEVDKITLMYKNKIRFRSKKLRTFNVRPNLKAANESECEECARKSGNWFYKWAKGRERCRRDRKISDWQFERAKGRERYRRDRENSDWQFQRAKSRADSRLGDAFWQFSRALGRETNRMYHFMKRIKVRYSFRKGFTSDAFSWIKM